jgi:glycosyltransferase involved in cell wall biosynthesis
MIGMVENKQALISICIPTFNRCKEVFDLVKNILNYEGDEIEVIVLDNCSTDNTTNVLNQIKDSRFVCIENESNIGGQLNILKVLMLATGMYGFLCLDKDDFSHRNIKELISRIKADEGIVFGRCALNLYQSGSDIIYEEGILSVLNMAYLSEHPTGNFYKTDFYKSLEVLKIFFKEKKPFPFYIDLINAEMAMLGKAILINLPTFYTETKDSCRDKQSFTYNEQNVFFSPDKRLIEFDVYLKSVQRLGLSNNESLKVIWMLYNKELTSSTFGYRDILNDNDVCIHYGMKLRKVGFVELCIINLKFSSYFFKQDLPIGYLKKLQIIFVGQLRFIYKLF